MGIKYPWKSWKLSSPMRMAVMKPVMNTFLGERMYWAISWPPSRG